jgi:serine/threonine protein kinase
MAYMHNREPKIIHRDLKPANIMIGGSSFMLSDNSVLLHTSGIVKVADFGLCKSLPKRGTRPSDESRSVRDREELKDTYRLTGAHPLLQAACLQCTVLKRVRMADCSSSSLRIH